MNSNTIAAFFAIKVMRLVFAYASLLIAKNLTSQVYMDKVLVNGENPPKLSNFIFMYLGIEAIMMVFFMILLYTAEQQFFPTIGFSDPKDNLFSKYVMPDYIISSIFIVLYGTMIASKMYEKKYFLYKDDGLRAIRALADLTFSVVMINTLLPWNYIFYGLMEVVQEMMNTYEGKST
jgi:hypothetical protein